MSSLTVKGWEKPNRDVWCELGLSETLIFPEKTRIYFQKRIYTDFCNYLKKHGFLRRACEDNVFM